MHAEYLTQHILRWDIIELKHAVFDVSVCTYILLSAQNADNDQTKQASLDSAWLYVGPRSRGFVTTGCNQHGVEAK
jgi:hypothetical protein